MAGAKPGVHVVQLKPVTVPEALINGNKFIKWEEDSSQGLPVTMKVDPKGYILYWKDQNEEMDYIDVALIRDTRTGKQSKLPKDSRLREFIAMGSADVPLEDKIMSIAVGIDLVNLTWISFSCINRDVALLWTSELFSYSANLLSLNSSPMSFLEKCYTKLSFVVSSDGSVPVKNVIKMFAQHKDDKKRVEKALEMAQLPSDRNDSILLQNFSYERFLTFYRCLSGRKEVEKIFKELCSQPHMTAEQFKDFLNSKQRDSRLNEILYQYCDIKRAKAIISQFEPTKSREKGLLSQEGFLHFLMSDENALISPEKFDLSEDMDQPLTHYFINSSHNTYLTGHQLTGKSSVEIYRQALLAGCRCLELDCWDGKGAEEEPIITHGFTMCTEISFKEVIEAIKECAFKVSEFPVILSFENHCSPKQQAKMAAHCRNILGDAILSDPLDSNPLQPNISFPGINLLKQKFIIKAKKGRVSKQPSRDNPSGEEEDRKATSISETKLNIPGGPSFDRGDFAVGDSDSECEMYGGTGADKGNTIEEAEAGLEMSALVNYIQPTHFYSFEIAEKRNRSYECSSFVETQATALLKEFPVDFVNYNKRQLSRIYPKGTRVDSSNYMPQIFWNAGCQLVALNFQSLDLPMQLNLGIFEYNGRSGYILKPDFMRRSDRTFDPFAESTVDGIVAGTMNIKIISGQFLSDKRVGTYVEAQMYGLPADTVRKKFRTKTIPNNAINPVWDEPPFVFRKVVLPNLATLRLGVYDESNRLLGHRVLPLEGIRPGYRHIGLRNEMNISQSLATLFVFIQVGDYVPDAFAEFAAALENPIAYQSAMEKHAQQLAILEDDDFNDDNSEVSEVQKTQTSNVGSRQVELNRHRNLSMVSQKSSQGTPMLSRGGSNKLHHLVKQESIPASQMSSVGAGSLSQPMGSSPHHLLSENGGVKKIDVNLNTKLKDPKLYELHEIDQLKNSKKFLKLKSKHDKDLCAMQKKNRKAKALLAETHALKEEKFLLSNCKAKINLEKEQRKSFKKASRKGGNATSEVSSKCQSMMQELEQSQQLELAQVREKHLKEMTSLSEEHLNLERDTEIQNHGQAFTLLQEIMLANNATQLRQIEDIHNKEALELKKNLDAQNREEMKLLAKKHKDKSELARIKREAQQRHIQFAVHEIQKLRDILEKQKLDLKEAQNALEEKLKVETSEEEEAINNEYECKLANLSQLGK